MALVIYSKRMLMSYEDNRTTFMTAVVNCVVAAAPLKKYALRVAPAAILSTQFKRITKREVTTSAVQSEQRLA